MTADGAGGPRPVRSSYEKGTLDERAVAPVPLEQFRRWFVEAAQSGGLLEPDAVTVATVSAEGQPSARVVLLRGYDARGFVFFTNYESRKGRELDAVGKAALLFYWQSLERQIRIEGTVARIEPVESDAYFAGRPRGHRLSAWASHQSALVPDRAFLETQMHLQDERFGDDVPRPPYWGGYRVAPASFEFWQGRRDRVHDRITYARDGDGDGDGDGHGWRMARLAP